MIGGGFMLSSDTGLKNNRGLLKDKNGYFKKSEVFFDVEENNNQNTERKIKVFDSVMNETERVVFLEKLKRKRNKNLMLDYFGIGFVFLIAIALIFYLF